MKNKFKNYKELILLTLIPILFLYKMIFFGEIITTNDEFERHPINEWRDNYFTENDDIPQWFPNLFSGMPSYGGYIYNNGDPTKFIRNYLLFNPGLKIWFYLSISGFGMFFLLKFLGISKKSAVFGAIISALTPYSFGLINAGHLNKIFAMAYIPWVLLSAIYSIKNRNIKSILFLSLVTALQLWVNHPQIAYYTWMVIGFYFCWDISLNIKNKNSIRVSMLKLGSILIGLVIAILMVSDPYADIYNFQKESSRGAKSVLDQTKETANGASWNYATQWSFHPKELISFIYPYHYGLQNTQDFKKGAYWGFMSFTQSTHYLGLITIILSILGLLIKPTKINIFFWLVTILTLLVGFGSHFPILYKPFFNLLPLFSKFRIPSMVYILLAVSMPISAAFALDSLIFKKNNSNLFDKVLYVAGSLFTLSVILLLFGNSIIDFSNSSEALRYSIGQISMLKTYRFDLFQKGLILALFVSGGFILLYWGFISKKISKSNFYYLLLILSVSDLWIVSYEFMNLKPKKNMDRLFTSSKVVDKIKEDAGYFRVFPADELRSNKYSYWNIESIGGYRPIKLRNYEDLMNARGFSKPQILNMLNVKYVITKKKINNPNFIKVNDLDGLYENINVLPKAWLVGKVKNVESQKESLMETLLTSFNPSKEAIVVDYKDKNIPVDVSGNIQILTKKENEIILQVNSETGGLLVLSEVYFRPGWIATVNGSDTKIYQTNHILRSIYVPQGESRVVFLYNDTVFKRSRILSRISFIIVLLGIGFLFKKNKFK
ncbi:MAG: hypothetical protein ACJZ14_06080 [Candidatus Neomarinimicrobiota bacterium]